MVKLAQVAEFPSLEMLKPQLETALSNVWAKSEQTRQSLEAASNLFCYSLSCQRSSFWCVIQY